MWVLQKPRKEVHTWDLGSAILRSKIRKRTRRIACCTTFLLNSMKLHMLLPFPSLRIVTQQSIDFIILSPQKLCNWLNEMLPPWFFSFILCSECYWGFYLSYRIFLQRAYISHLIMNNKGKQIKASKSFQLSISVML